MTARSQTAVQHNISPHSISCLARETTESAQWLLLAHFSRIDKERAWAITMSMIIMASQAHIGNAGCVLQ